MRGRMFNWVAIGRAVLVLAVGGLLVFAAVRLATSGKDGRLGPTVLPSSAAVEQRRCEALGLAAEQDAGCRALWARSRARFLGQPDGPALRGRP